MRFAGLRYFAKRTVTRQVLDRDEARALLAPQLIRAPLAGLRDRALIGTMIYTFARVGAVLQMNVADYFTQGRRDALRSRQRSMWRLTQPCA